MVCVFDLKKISPITFGPQCVHSSRTNKIRRVFPLFNKSNLKISPPIPFSYDISLGTANTVPAHPYPIPVKECAGQAQYKLDCHLTQQHSYATVSC